MSVAEAPEKKGGASRRAQHGLDATSLLTTMVNIPSPTGSESELAATLVDVLGDAGFSTHRDAVGNVVASWGDGATEIMLVGHIDTVPGIVPVREENGRLYGRGTVDAKGPFAAAAVAVSRQPKGHRYRFTLVGAVDEEGDSQGALHLSQRVAPAHLIVLEPSGWDAVTLGYKGMLRLRVSVDQNVGHGAGQEPSAADRVYRLVQWLTGDAKTEVAHVFERTTARIVDISTQSNGLREQCSARIDVRLPVGVNPDTLAQEIQEWAGDTMDVDVDIRGTAVHTSKNSALSRAFVRAIREYDGSPRFKVKTGTADMNLLVPVWGCPAVAYGPGDSHLDHTPNESIALDELERGVDVLTTVLTSL